MSFAENPPLLGIYPALILGSDGPRQLPRMISVSFYRGHPPVVSRLNPIIMLGG